MTVPDPALGVAFSLDGTVGAVDGVGAALLLGRTVAGCEGGGGVGPDDVQADTRSRSAPAAVVARDLMWRLV
jgi:hypothetical protein